MMINEVKEKARSVTHEVIGWRRHIHAHPELSYQEYNTAAYVAAQLKALNIEVQEGVAGTGITGLIKGNNPDAKIVALRADMDALPIQEANEVDYRSTNDRVMHACGHDAHTASLLGAAKILASLRHRFEGTIKLIFQPGEEKLPGGASLMIKAGALTNPAPHKIIGQHVMPYIPAGKVGFREGMYMASCDEIYVTVTGKGGHGAMPERCIDPVLIASHIVVALQQVISRNASPKQPTVLTFGKVEANGATNVIPNEVTLAGTFRAMDEEWRTEAHQRMKKMAESIAEGMGGSCHFDIRRGYPFLQNEPELTRRAKEAAVNYMGQENVLDLDLWLAAEDFSYYSQEMDACFYRLGTRNEDKGIVSGLHTPTFNIDESALETGCGLMSWLALEELAAR